MADYIILTNKGPALFREETASMGKVLLAGAEYPVPIEAPEEHARDQLSEDQRVQRAQQAIASALKVLQAQTCAKGGSKKKQPVEIVFLGKKAGDRNIAPKHAKTKLQDIILGGLTELFQFRFFGSSKKAKAVSLCPEGDFSHERVSSRKSKSIEAIKVFEVDNQEELFDCKYTVVFGEPASPPAKPAPETGGELPKPAQAKTELALERLKAFEANFYASELGFILNLLKSKSCIAEIGQWIYNSHYTAIFGNLITIIEIMAGMFINTAVRALPTEVFGIDIEAELGSKSQLDHSRILYLSEEKKQQVARIVGRLQAIWSQNEAPRVMGQVALPFIEYCEELANVLYSHHFIRYISTVEDNIKLYKSQTKSEIAAAERKFRCNICFLFVDIYHRVIKYKMYLDEARKLLADETEQLHPVVAATLARLDEHTLKLEVLLKATERCKSVKQLKALKVVMPDCVDMFVDLLELTNGFVVITQDNLVIINEKFVVALISKREIWGCYTDSKDFSTSYIDLAISSLYPPIPDFVVDCVNGVRVHWIRLHFKWEGYQEKFINSFNSQNVPNIPDLDIALVEHSVAVNRRLRERIFKGDVLRSHLRMLTIREQRKYLPTLDLYTYGLKEKLSEQLIFKIKSWVDQSLADYAEIIRAAPGPSACSGSYLKELLEEVQQMIMHHPAPSKLPPAQEHTEFSKVLTEPPTIALAISIYVEYLSYILRCLSPEDRVVFSNSAINSLSSVHELVNPTLGNNEFLELSIGCTREMLVPSSLTRNEFLLSLLVIRFLVIIAPDIHQENFLALCAPLFLFNSRALAKLPQGNAAAFQ